MNRLLLLSASFVLAACTALKPIPSADVPGNNRAAAIPSRWQDIPVAPLTWNAPLISLFADTLRPGVVVFWVPDSSLPLASIQWLWPEGSLGLDSRRQVAAGLLGDLLRRGGAGNLTGAQVDDTLEFLAAQASLDVGMVRTTGSVSGFSRDLPSLVDLLTTMILAPRLEADRLDVVKAEALQNLEHRFDTPAQTVRLAWDRIANGRGPWTELTDSAELAGVRRDDLREALRGRFGASKLWITVAGRYDRAEVRALLSRQLERLASGPSRETPVGRLDSVPRLAPMAPPGVYVYDIPATQVQIRLGGRFVKRDHPDYYPLMLASHVLGGSGFGSRLVERVRSDEGLAYNVSSWAGSDYDREANWGVQLQTKNASAGRALVIIDREIRRLADSGFRAGELEQARKGLSASVPSLFDTPENTADLLLQSAAWGRRDDHFRLYRRALDSIPDSTVLRAFRTWFRPESVRVVISGPLDSLKAPFADGSPALGHWGPVHRLTSQDLLRRGPLPFEGTP